MSLYRFMVVASDIRAPQLSSRANVSVYVKPIKHSGFWPPFGSNLIVVISLSSVLGILLLLLIIIVITCVHIRRRRRAPIRRGYISGDMYRPPFRDCDVVRMKGKLPDTLRDTKGSYTYNTTLAFPSMDKNSILLSYPKSLMMSSLCVEDQVGPLTCTPAQLVH